MKNKEMEMFVVSSFFIIALKTIIISFSVSGGFGTVTESWLKDKSPENCLTTVEIFDPETNTWDEGPELLVPLCAMGVVKYYGTIYVMGKASRFICTFSLSILIQII